MYLCNARVTLALIFAYLAIRVTVAAVEDVCAKYGDAVAIPGLDGRNFCHTAGLNVPNMEKCILLDFAGKSFTRTIGDSVGMVACRAAHQLPPILHAVDGQPIAQHLRDYRPLPDSFQRTLLSEEGSSYYFWWSAVYNLGIAASCLAANTARTVSYGMPHLHDPAHTWRVPPGWGVHSLVWSNANMDTAEPGLYLPLAAILHKEGTLAVVIRGTETFSDWQTDFTYAQVSTSGPLTWPGRTHEGFSKLAAYLWHTGVQPALDSLVLQHGSNVREVVVAGHSMGAGVSTLLSYTMQTYLEKNRRGVRVDALLFAPPNVGDAAFARAFGAVVNARRIPFESDIVAQLPCTPTVTACERGPWEGSPLMALGVWSYQQVPGTVALSAADMPMQQEAWGSFQAMYACQLGRYVLATHVCAYQCCLSQFVQGGGAHNMCVLRQQDPEKQVAGEGSYCLSFPVASGTQYPYERPGGLFSLLT